MALCEPAYVSAKPIIIARKFLMPTAHQPCLSSRLSTPQIKGFQQPEDTVSAQMSEGGVFLLIACLNEEQPPHLRLHLHLHLSTWKQSRLSISVIHNPHVLVLFSVE
jgi:hypothetical protein